MKGCPDRTEQKKEREREREREKGETADSGLRAVQLVHGGTMIASPKCKNVVTAF